MNTHKVIVKEMGEPKLTQFLNEEGWLKERQLPIGILPDQL
jgi:hypothetical protein